MIGIKWSYKDNESSNKVKYYEIGFLRSDKKIGIDNDHFEKFIDTFVDLINGMINEKNIS